MYKLLRAYFSRLAKNRVFWICMSAVFLIAAFSVLNFYRQTQAVDAMENAALDDQFFGLMPLFGIPTAVAISLFLGTEYSDGTLRNKLIIGSSRTSIYLSSAVTGAAASAALTLAGFLGGLVGMPLLGAWAMPFSEVLLYILAGMLSSIALAAIFTFIGVNCSRKAEGAVIAILAALALLIAGSIIYNWLQEPEMVSSMVMTENGMELTEPKLNPHYVGGTLRSVLTALLHILPSGQQVLMANLELADPMECICYSIGLTFLVTACGAAVFRKKDIK